MVIDTRFLHLHIIKINYLHKQFDEQYNWYKKEYILVIDEKIIWF